MVKDRPVADSTPDPEEDLSPEAHYVLTVHGIRTNGAWQERLGTLLQKAKPWVRVRHFKYGVFDVISYFFPFLRLINVWRFRRYLERLAREHPGARIDIVAHSFGTYIVGHSLEKLSGKVDLRVHTVILAGSVLKVWFPWDELIDKGVVCRLVNECGTKDNVLLLTQLAILFTGMAGRIGFSGLLDDSFKNRFYEFGHGGYFGPFGEAGTDADRIDAFMRQQWVPLLTSDASVADHDARRANVLTPLEHFLLDKADPIKLLGYGAVLFALVWYFGVVPYRNAAVQRAKAQVAQEHTDAIAERAFRAMHAFDVVVTGDTNLQTRADLSPTRKKLLETARGLFHDMVEQLHDGREMGEDARRGLAKAHIEIARLTSEIGGLDSGNIGSAIVHFEDAIRILAQLPPNDPRTRWAQTQAYSGLGEAYLNRQKMEGSGDPTRAGVAGACP